MMEETLTEAEKSFKDVCEKIDKQNKLLMERMDKPDFDPVVELDNTRNDAGYYLTDFFAVCKLFQYGHVPTQLSNEMVKSTDQLIEKIKTKYKAHKTVLEKAIRAGESFRSSKRIWRIRANRPMAQREYESYLDVCCNKIFDALKELHVALSLACGDGSAQKSVRALLTADFASQAMGVSLRTLHRIEADPARCAAMGYPGRNVDRQVFINWATPIRNGRLLDKAARARARTLR